MPDFANRSHRKELLDRTDIPFADIRKNMQELDTINRYLGGHAITLSGLRRLFPLSPATGGTLTICEIGCGGGDNLQVIAQWCEKRKIPVHLLGIDINPHCIEFARSQHPEEGFTFIRSDYKMVHFDKKPDIIFSSLFCHHFGEEELAGMLQWMQSYARAGYFINDLHRHPVAYYAIRWLTRLFSKSYLVKNDAPLSVLKGFHKNEWEEIFGKAGIITFSIEWRWAFRWLIVVKK